MVDETIEFWDRAAVMSFFGGMTVATLYRQIHRGVIPKPVHVSNNIARWVASECKAAARAMIDKPREFKKVDLTPKDDRPRKKRGPKPKQRATEERAR